MADVAPAGAPVPQILPFQVALPEQSTTQGNSTATPTPFGATKDQPLGIETAPRAQYTQAGQDLAAATSAKGAANVGQVAAQSEGAGQTATQTTANLAELEKFDRAQAVINNEVHARKLDLQNQVKNFKDENYWEHAGTFRRVLAVIASGLLSAGTGQPQNVVLELADAEHRKNMDRLSHLEKQLEMAGVDEEHVRKFGEDARVNLLGVHAARLNNIAAQTTAMAARYNTPAAKAQADIDVAAAKQASAKAEIDFDAGLRSSVARQFSETKNTATKAPASTEAGEKGAEAQIFGTAIDNIGHGITTLTKRQAREAEEAADKVVSQVKVNEKGEMVNEAMGGLLGESGPIEGLRSPGQRAYARAMVTAATTAAKKTGAPPKQVLHTLMPRSDAPVEQNARALKNLHDMHDAMVPPRIVNLGNGQTAKYVNGKLVVLP